MQNSSIRCGASGAIQNAIHGRSQLDRRSTHAHGFRRCPAVVFFLGHVCSVCILVVIEFASVFCENS